MDMMQLYERAFNPQLCQDMVQKADESFCKPTFVVVNGHPCRFKGSSINYAQVMELAKKDWCSRVHYKVFYREQNTDPMKELKPGVCVRLTLNMAFTVSREDGDTWAEAEIDRRISERMGSGIPTL